MGHRKSRFVLSARFPVANWRSRSVAKSAYWHSREKELFYHTVYKYDSFVISEGGNTVTHLWHLWHLDSLLLTAIKTWCNAVEIIEMVVINMLPCYRLNFFFLFWFQQKKFWFATGGAGFCLSRALVNKMRPYIRYCCNHLRSVYDVIWLGVTAVTMEQIITEWLRSQWRKSFDVTGY